MAKQQPKRGRPPKPEGEVKEGVYQIRLTDAERESFERAAEFAGEKLSAWMRNVLTRAAKRSERN